jgi:hypothetical protein
MQFVGIVSWSPLDGSDEVESQREFALQKSDKWGDNFQTSFVTEKNIGGNSLAIKLESSNMY